MPTPVYFEDVTVGDTLPELAPEPITPVQLVRYAGASGDFNPLHTVDAVGKRAGYDGVIAHGMLIMALAARCLTQWTPQRNLRRLKVRFAGVTRPGERLTVQAQITGKRPETSTVEGEIAVRDDAGHVKLTGSFAIVLQQRG